MRSYISKKNIFCYFTLSIKNVLILFLLLSVLVLLIMFSSSSKLSVIVNMSLRTKMKVLATTKNLLRITSPNVSNARLDTLETYRRLNHEKFLASGELVHNTSQNDGDGSSDEDVVKISNRNDSSELSQPSKSQSQTEESQYGFNKLRNLPSTKTEYILKFSEMHYLKSNRNQMTERHGEELRRSYFCDNCFINNFSYVIQNDRICSLSSDDTIDVVILIMTAHEHTAARHVLRSTWLTHARNNTSNIRYVFLLGEINDQTQRENILKENEIYHDIIKQDFIDSYKNLTYKTIIGFKWVTAHCAHARHVMKTDDDIFVNVPNLLKTFRQLGPKMDRKVIGSCAKYAKPIRNPNSKWFASFNSYPETSYPGFCSGTGYAMNIDVASRISLVSPNVPFFHLEDVYVALCIRQLGYLLQTVPGFNAGKFKMDPCVYKGEKLITAHNFTPVMLKDVWQHTCSTPVWQTGFQFRDK